ncbi:diaminopimelate decarboxylase [Pseudoduganella namucuonensis]|uniref:Diaminopimelate decarboxylase n=1 Tax=Pseudoduganella namucuonensis TaxID=1035707 RepID=A0A1I7KX95_9BURK|nr:diaminopimelate decarboxylase [Pseudoduganella namucuonensis]SFV01936.1 diaminopimelate decarboxylase [Pseudoduganella namucuonensis]
MDHFSYIDGRLHAEGVDAHGIVERYGSPVYVYSARTLREHVATLRQAFAPAAPMICFSVKSCANLSVLRLLADAGCGMDVVSGGELYRALAAGVAADRIVFAGVGKSMDEIRYAVEQGVHMFNAESEAEMARLDEAALAAGKRVRVAVRVNPDVADAGTPAKTSTGGRQTKFGVPLSRAAALFVPGRHRGLDVCGVHVHLGSPIHDTRTYLAAIGRIEELVAEVERGGGRVDTVNLGGGFPAHYGRSEGGAELVDMGRAICERLEPLRARGKRFIIEPGRSISANAGVLLTTVEYVKQGWDRLVTVLNAGMNTLLRPSMYGAEHFMWPAQHGSHTGHWNALAGPNAFEPTDIVGPICETGDYFALGRPLPPMKSGDVLAVFSCGAYGMSMASQYNARARPAEVMVDGTEVREIRRRESYADLVAHEVDGMS